ncbi:nicotinamide-nucleotide amidase [Atopomonas hussainii]|uniref:Nicotinamide-nucleotide amidase n=1 Tax=Atopomonas hussainii TaxID=1429083 RepID=A0A1H7H316_9GAMM|nr:nicotinamide-nucleotide amidohydrolase family protein [Atopomonas hussainii]SEK44638.1 nicotinamide-nucleotide amidase [Atopomonas hussainii]
MSEHLDLQISQLAAELGTLLQAHAWQVTTAESCTGGGIAEAITRIAGSSAWFEAGFVVYSNAQKTRQLGVSEALLAAHGAVSEPVVCAMAQGALQLANAQWGVAVSGIAGPGGGSEHKPVGTVWLAWAGPGGIEAQRFLFTGDRHAVRQQSVVCALQGLLLRIRTEKNNRG